MKIADRSIAFKVLVCLAVVFSSGGRLCAQITLHDGTGNSTLMIEVYDKSSWVLLPDAVISIGYKKDTSYFTTSSDRIVVIPHKYGRDTATISISLLGYKPLSCRSPLAGKSQITVLMQENPIELNAIVVKEDAILMIARGDTTVYNPTSIKMMSGDNLAQLLRKLPGIEIDKDDSSVKAGGQTVNKILVNGQTLFGSNISAALRLIDSEMVDKVKVYDQHDQERLSEADTLERKDRVVDVVTKEKLTKIQLLQLKTAIGMFTEKQTDGCRDMSAYADLSIERFEVDKPRITGRVKILKNVNSYSFENVPSDTPTERIEGYFDFNSYEKMHKSVRHELRFSADRSNTSSRTRQVYNNIDRFNSSVSENNTGDISVSYKTSNGFGLDKGSVKISAAASYDRRMGLGTSRDTTAFNGEHFFTDVISDRLSDKVAAEVGLSYSYPFKKPHRSVNLNLQIPFEWMAGTQSVMDLNPGSSYIQNMSGKDENRCFRPNLVISYSEPIIKDLNFRVEGSVKENLSRNMRNSIDHILNIENPTNTFSYTQNNVSGMVKALVSYNNLKTLSIRAGAEAAIINQIVNERKGDIGNGSSTYYRLSPHLEFEWNKGGMKLSLVYRESEYCPSVEQLRNSLNYTDQMFLTSGNPSLKMPVNRTAKLEFNIPSYSIGATWGLEASYSNTSDFIGNDTRYFAQDTYLPQYNYTAAAGSQLMRPENIGNSWQLAASLLGSVFVFNTFTLVRVGASAARTPFMTYGQHHENQTKEVHADLVLTSGFSEVVGFSLNGYYGYGVNDLDSDRVFRYSDIRLTASGNVQIAKKYKIDAKYLLDTKITDMTGMGYMMDRLNLYAGMKFGKSYSYEIGISAQDVLNSDNGETLSVTDLYINSLRTSYLGRCVLLTFTAKFK